MFRGTMGGLELSKLTVFWNFIDSFSGKLLSDSSVRIPFAGLEKPARAGWSHGDVPCEPKKRRAPHGPANWVRVQVSQGSRSGQLVDRPLPILPMRAPNLILHAPRPRVHRGFSIQPILEEFGLLTLVAKRPLLARSGHSATSVRSPKSSKIGCMENPL